VEPTEEQLIAYMNSIPMFNEFILLKVYVLPMSIEEIWDYFYADQSLFYAADAYDNDIDSYTNWFKPFDPLYQTFEKLFVFGSNRNIA
jgi:hypothetical protein